MKASGLTDKKMANKRFLKTEQAIFIAYFTLRGYPSARKLASAARISRSTLYRHHKKIHSIPVEYEDYLLHNYTKSIRKLLRNNAEIKTIFLCTLVFISNNKAIFVVLFRDGRRESIRRMMECLKTRVIDEWRLAGNTDKMYGIYKNEILGIIEIWFRQNFATKYIDSTLNDILYLTGSARRNLLPLQ